MGPGLTLPNDALRNNNPETSRDHPEAVSRYPPRTPGPQLGAMYGHAARHACRPPPPLSPRDLTTQCERRPLLPLQAHLPCVSSRKPLL